MRSRLIRYFILIVILFLFGDANNDLAHDLRNELKIGSFSMIILILALDFLSTYVTILIYTIYIRDWTVGDRELYIITLLSATLAPLIATFIDYKN